MGTSCFYNSFIFSHQSGKCISQAVNSREQFVFDLHNCSNVHGSWKSIVGALGHVGMIIWMEDLFACNGISTSCDHFVYIHIGLGAASGLPYGQREVIIQFTSQYFVTGLGNEGKALLIQFTKTIVCNGCCLF